MEAQYEWSEEPSEVGQELQTETQGSEHLHTCERINLFQINEISSCLETS